MRTEGEKKILFRAIAVCSRFSKRISKLPKQLQEILLADVETAIENRLKVLERIKE